jgi:hypothetical protein
METIVLFCYRLAIIEIECGRKENLKLGSITRGFYCIYVSVLKSLFP